MFSAGCTMNTGSKKLQREVGSTFCNAQGTRGGLTLAFWSLTLKGMEVRLSPDQEAFVRRAIESGRFHRAEDAVEEALLLWEERERNRAEFLATLDDAKASLARGEGRIITQQSMRDLAEEVKQRGQVRLAAEQSSPR
jgi:putative addiction module CopG family antidote